MALNNTYEARLVQQETALGAGAQLLLLALLGSVIGMGTAGWATGLVFALGTWALLSGACHRSGIRTFGPANRVTLGRAVLVGGVTALVADSFESAPPVTLLVGLTAVALILDGVDGKVARRTGTSTPLGARFDMEVDAFLILVLSVYVSTQLGPWVLLMGAMRYVFVAAAFVWPWLNSALPHSMARKTVAATQGVCLLLAGSELLPYAANLAIAGTSLAALIWSFGRDVLWLFRTRPGAAKAVEEGTAPEPASGAVTVTVPRGAEAASVEARAAAEPVMVISEPIVAALASQERPVLAAR
ncbi:CDP-alcohol phosphatidyltransferase family protein [Streptomyces niveiscabiei]|uniref:CDP-alcohol phosphatidyltransferase family protein n=1 Tax=Streptomyces niveiscabiei TaxID=164115 RepID=UPI0029B2A563|nr:CDP-alcohol phosphatidyltransferase family protein [Streptomyces niveiscabiei]MDX3380943.1 CDP-alcohol phosphatidyltransferase family protein [Streptomyces niveiscabiei]